MVLKVLKSGSTGNGYILESEEEALILDVGAKFSDCKRALDFNIKKIKGGLLTHYHSDHIGRVKEYRHAGIPLYSNDETANYIKEKYNEKINVISEKKEFSIGNYRIIPFYVPHDGTPNFAYIIKFPNGDKMLYATDFEYLPYSFKNMRLNYILIECNHMDDAPERDSIKYEHSVRGHSSLSTVKKIIEVNKTPALRNIILCHLSSDWSHSDIMIKEINEVVGKRVIVSVAYPGFELYLCKFPF